MAIRFDASTDYFRSPTISPHLRWPMTISLWFIRDASGPTAQAIFGLFEVGNFDRVHIRTAEAGGVLNVDVIGTGSTSAATTNTFTNGVWNHGIIILRSNISRTVILNGDLAGRIDDTESVTWEGSQSATLLGASETTSIGGFWNGDIAEVGVWDVALNGAEARDLARGNRPDQIRPNRLVHYWDCEFPHINTLVDRGYAGISLPVFGTPIRATHPQMLPRSYTLLPLFARAAAVGDINTENKRRSVWGAGLPWMRMPAVPDGTIVAADRAQMRIYSGIAVDSPAGGYPSGYYDDFRPGMNPGVM